MSKRSRNDVVVAAASSSNVEYRVGDILDGPEHFLVHQCNCQTKSSRGLAKQVFTRYPAAANTYQRQRTPGTIDVIEGVANDRHVVNLYAQDSPGGRTRRSEPRERWFDECLVALQEHIQQLKRPLPVTVAFPYAIGCGLAGGDWDVYRNKIEQFALQNQTLLHVVVYCLSE